MASFTDAALLISANRRPYYLKQTLASWDQVPELNEFRHITIALGRSPREDEQVHLIDEFRWAVRPPVSIKWDSAAAVVSPGMHRALGEAMHDEFAAEDDLRFLVCSEEDIIVSDDVLSYMAWARRKFDDDPRVLTISAHNPLGQGWHDLYDDSKADQDVARLTPKFHPWCWGTWNDRWEKYLRPTWDWNASSGTTWSDNGYDWQIVRVMDKHQLLTVSPDASRSQNIGQHEGVYAQPELFDATLAASFRPHRDNPSYRLES